MPVHPLLSTNPVVLRSSTEIPACSTAGHLSLVDDESALHGHGGVHLLSEYHTPRQSVDLIDTMAAVPVQDFRAREEKAQVLATTLKAKIRELRELAGASLSSCET